MRKITLGLCLFILFSSFSFSTALPPAKRVTIKKILTSPTLLNCTVEVKAIYKGWGGKIGSPPKTKSDYIIEDSTGQIYVTGPLPRGVRMRDLGAKITLKVKVRSTITNYAGKKAKVIYLEVQ